MHLKSSPSGMLAVVAMLLSAVPGFAAITVPQTPEIQLRPHVAIYEMKLYRAAPGSNVSDVRGRMVYSFRGSPCAGYTLVNRLVTRLTDRDGKEAVTDMRSSTWEAARGAQFRFTSAQYLDQKLSEQAAGQAARGDGADALHVTIDKPRKHKMTLSGQPMFPTQHSLAILDAARAGRSEFRTKLYDGSEKGGKVLETAAAIGKPLPGEANLALPRVKNAEQLDGVESWPISIGYFDTNKFAKSDEGLPNYELSFRLYANGVSRKLLIDYGNFAVEGELSQIEFYEPSKCPGQGEPTLAPISVDNGSGKKSARTVEERAVRLYPDGRDSAPL